MWWLVGGRWQWVHTSSGENVRVCVCVCVSGAGSTQLRVTQEIFGGAYVAQRTRLTDAFANRVAPGQPGLRRVAPDNWYGA
jgi:hypothetical protein